MNKYLVKKVGLAGGALALTAAFALSAQAAPGDYTLFGDAQIVPGGNPGNAAQLRSDVTVPPGFGGVSFDIGDGIAWADLDTLSTDYNVTDDDCGGGSPRFQLAVDTNNDGVSDGNVFVHLGPAPSFTDCTPNTWLNDGNLIGSTEPRYGYGAFGGTPFGDYDDAPAIVQAGTVVGVSLVVDSSWSADATGGDGEQTVLVDNVMINDILVTFDPSVAASKEACKKGGWQTLVDDEGNSFKNQGDCVSFVATGGKNKAN